MSIRKIWYESVRLFIKLSLHFYTKQIKVYGKNKIPKKGAVLFAINHPNALMDPLFVTSNSKRENHYLVRADVFKKPLIRKALASLNLMPIYRIRDGRKELSNNQEVFEKCFDILAREEILIIFPQGGHSRDRNIKPLSKGFTRIVFGALERNPTLDITVIPVGVTYQNSSSFPSKVSIHFGELINSREILRKNEKPKAINILKNEVRNQLEKLTVHIPDDENYAATLKKLNQANVDFTNIEVVNKMIADNNFPKAVKKPINLLKPLFYIIILNSIFPLIIWKKVSKNIAEIEFIDTMKYAVNVISFPIFYTLQALIIGFFFGWNIAVLYWFLSILLVFAYTKFSISNTED